MNPKIADIRINYSQKSLSETDVVDHPITQFKLWWEEAIASDIKEANAMTLATVGKDGIPNARIVLLKNITDKGFVFYTNYESHKGQDLAAYPHACLVFFWKELERQVRITGSVNKITEAESEAYFYSRPVASQVSAIISPQSQVINGRKYLDEKLDAYNTLLAQGQRIKKPAHWGGYLVTPATIEFWQGRRNRLHDRLKYILQEDASWKIERLAP